MSATLSGELNTNNAGRKDIATFQLIIYHTEFVQLHFIQGQIFWGGCTFLLNLSSTTPPPPPKTSMSTVYFII